MKQSSKAKKKPVKRTARAKAVRRVSLQPAAVIPGEVILGEMKLAAAEPPAEFHTIFKWADVVRKGTMGVRANADTGDDAANARALGAEGIGLCRTDRVKLEFLGASRSHPGPVLRGRKSLWRMLDYLQSMPGDSTPAANNITTTTDLATSVREFCLRNPGRGILVLISDLMDKSGYETALRLLLARQMDVYVIQLLSNEELHPELQGDLKLVDCEDKDVAEITVSRPLLDRYQKTLAAFVEGAREFCTRRGMTYLLANTQIPVDQLVANYLRQRGLVR